VRVALLAKFLKVILVPPLEILGLLRVNRIKDVVNIEKFVFDDFQLLLLVRPVQYTFCHFCKNLLEFFYWLGRFWAEFIVGSPRFIKSNRK
jgi:hypothetical protein